MKTQGSIRRTTNVVLYAIVLYYLLPFSPLAIYDSAYRANAGECQELKAEKANSTENDVAGAFYQLHKRNHIFPQKEGIRFFFCTDIILEQPNEEVSLPHEKEDFIYLKASYSNPFFLSLSGRGPPLA